jgi:hypothetical protein
MIPGMPFILPYPASAPVRRLVRSAWRGSMAEYAWNDLTPLGRYTIGVPLIIMIYLCLPLILAMALPFFIGAKLGVLDHIESFLEGIKRAFFK